MYLTAVLRNLAPDGDRGPGRCRSLHAMAAERICCAGAQASAAYLQRLQALSPLEASTSAPQVAPLEATSRQSDAKAGNCRHGLTERLFASYLRHTPSTP
eukprot:scaffold7620_cov484-Prasinococcus_capsulatus_cf.AAC.2